MDFKLEKNSEFTQPIPVDWNAFVFILEGTGVFGTKKLYEVSAHNTIVFTKGDSVSFRNNKSEVLQLVLIAGMYYVIFIFISISYWFYFNLFKIKESQSMRYYVLHNYTINLSNFLNSLFFLANRSTRAICKFIIYAAKTDRSRNSNTLYILG